MKFRSKLQEQGASEEEALRAEHVATIISIAIGADVKESMAIAIMDTISSRRIVLTDGSCWNDPSEPSTEIWLSDAALVASVLCNNPREPWLWWRQRYLVYSKEDSAYNAVLNAAVAALRSSPLVMAVED